MKFKKILPLIFSGIVVVGVTTSALSSYCDLQDNKIKKQIEKH